MLPEPDLLAPPLMFGSFFLPPNMPPNKPRRGFAEPSSASLLMLFAELLPARELLAARAGLPLPLTILMLIRAIFSSYISTSVNSIMPKIIVSRSSF